MAGYILELKGSGDFTKGPTGTDGKGLAVVINGESHDEALALAQAFFPAVVAGVPRGSVNVKDEGGDVYLIDVDYKSAVATENAPTAGQSPETARPPAGSAADNNTPLTRDVTFSTGGSTKRIYFSKKTRHKVAKTGDTAPDFGGLIGVNLKDGKIEGCEVIAAMSDFTITKRFQLLTLGWFRNMLDLVACTNITPWLGMDVGEVLHKGCDGNFKDGDQFPWTVTGKFGYSRNRTIADSPDELTVGALAIPDVRGWDHVWVSYAAAVQESIVHNGQNIKVMIEYPRWAYVEQVYSEGELANLGLN